MTDYIHVPYQGSVHIVGKGDTQVTSIEALVGVNPDRIDLLLQSEGERIHADLNVFYAVLNTVQAKLGLDERIDVQTRELGDTVRTLTNQENTCTAYFPRARGIPANYIRIEPVNANIEDMVYGLTR